MCWEIDIQTLELAVDHAVPYDPGPTPLSSSLGAVGEHYFRQSPTDKGTFVKDSPGFQWGSSCTAQEQKSMSLGKLVRVRGTV